MATRLVNVVFKAADQHRLAEFWSELLGWPIVLFAPDEVDVRAPAEQGWEFDLVFDPVAKAKMVKNRVHLDLASKSAEDQAAIVARARDLGAKPVDIGQGEMPWVVLADPEDNEFCVLDHRAAYKDAGALAAIVVDSVDAVSLSRFWVEATGWVIANEHPRGVALHAPNGRGPWLEFLHGHPAKTVENRLHLDVRPAADDDQQAEVDRLIKLGAKCIDIGQVDVPWEVMADPEDNEFCVLTPR